MSSKTAPRPYRDTLAGALWRARETAMTPIRKVLLDAGVTEQQWRVLRVLVDTGSMDPSALAQAAMLWPPSLTRILRELIRRKLISRIGDPGDKRRSVIHISPSGERLVLQTFVHTRRVVAEYERTFGPARLQNLIAELGSFRAAIDGAAAPASGEEL